MKVDLIFKEDGQEYARVIRLLDDYNRCEATVIDTNQRLLCRVPAGTVRIAAGDTILVGINGNNQQDEEVDVIHKYNQNELRLLRGYGELPEKVVLNEDIGCGLMWWAMLVGKFRFCFRGMA